MQDNAKVQNQKLSNLYQRIDDLQREQTHRMALVEKQINSEEFHIDERLIAAMINERLIAESQKI